MKKYLEIAKIIKKYIVENKLKEEEKLESEIDMSLKYGVSRSTVRQALKFLEKDGIVSIRHGHGTFVGSKKIDLQLVNFFSFKEVMKKENKKFITEVLSNKLTSCLPNDISDISDISKMHYIERVRLIDGYPMMLQQTYLNPQLLKNISKTLDNISIYDIFKENNILEFSGEEKYSATLLSKTELKKLQKKEKNIAATKITRILFSKEQLIEYTTEVLLNGYIDLKININT